MSAADPSFYGLGFDFGTSGARLNVVDSADLSVIYAGEFKYSEQRADVWLNAMETLLEQVPPELRQRTERIAVSGTSASVLVVDGNTGAVTRGPRMYDFSATGAPGGDEAMRTIAAHAPAGHTVRSSTSTLPKVRCHARPPRPACPSRAPSSARRGAAPLSEQRGYAVGGGGGA